MANYDHQCYADCEVPYLGNLVEYVEETKAFIAKNNGQGSVGALYGISDRLKALRQS